MYASYVLMSPKLGFSALLIGSFESVFRPYFSKKNLNASN